MTAIEEFDLGEIPIRIINSVKALFELMHVHLKDRAYVSLFLAVYGSVILIRHTNDSLSSILFSWEIAPLLLYFLASLLWETVLKRFVYRFDIDYKKLEQGEATLSEIALFIERHAIKHPEKVIERIDMLIKENSFTENMQMALIKNYLKSGERLRKYINNILLSYDFSQKALGTFLSLQHLQEDFLKKLIDKYRSSNSFLFNLGRYQIYKFESGSNEKNYYMAGHKFENFSSRLHVIFVIAFLSGIALLIYSSQYLENKNVNAILAAAVIFIPIFIVNKYEKIKVKKFLNDENVGLGDEIELEKFLDELNLSLSSKG